VIGQIDNKHVRANPKVELEYDRMRQSSASFTMNQDTCTTTLTVALLNIRSLRKHCIDIKHDARLTACDILALTETQLLPHHSDSTIKETLDPFTLYRQDHPTDKYSSLAICTKENIDVLQMEYFPDINGLICKLNFSRNQTMTFLLIYRKNNPNVACYVENMNNILRAHTIDIVLGDFNLDYLNESNTILLRHLMNSHCYTQIVDTPTFISAGSLLDHVFVKQSFQNTTQYKVISVYYSDHDALKIVIQQLTT